MGKDSGSDDQLVFSTASAISAFIYNVERSGVLNIKEKLKKKDGLRKGKWTVLSALHLDYCL